MSQTLLPSCARPWLAPLKGLCLITMLMITGCGAESQFDQFEPQSGSTSSSTPTQPVAALVQEEAAAADAHLAKQMEERKIVYHAHMHLELKTFEEAVDALHKLVEEHQGFIASHDIDGSAGYRRSGHWTIRVPSDSFTSFHEGLKALGFPIKDSTTSQEVTEEYVDVERRIANLKRMEERLQEHLEKSTKNLNDIFDVEKELTRVGAETERLQGRLQLLKDLTALATVELEMSEKEVYEPVAPPAPPTFAARINSTFEGSSNVLIAVLEGITLFFVGLAPWLPFLIVAGIALRIVYKKCQPASPEF